MQTITWAWSFGKAWLPDFLILRGANDRVARASAESGEIGGLEQRITRQAAKIPIKGPTNMSLSQPRTYNSLTSDFVIWGVPYRDKKPLSPISLSDGVVVGSLTAEETRQHFPDPVPAFIVIQTERFGGVQVVTLDPQADQSSFRTRDVFVLEGVYVLPSDELAAVYFR
jgi:hypothetical protein